MRQLHSADIAHQDVKPSNVLVFNGQKTKIADLGRATMQSNPSTFEASEHVGDRNYWPLELLYRDETPANWLERRLGADFFMMGCVMTFLLTDSSFLTLLFEQLDKRFWPKQWEGSYQEVIPHLLTALSSVTLEIKAALPEPLAAELVEMICCFAHPNPKKRGDVRATFRGTDALAHTGIISAQYDLEYIISRVDHLATLAKRLQCPAPKEPNKRKFLDLLFDR